MQQSVNDSTTAQPTQNDPTTGASHLRTVMGEHFQRKCACGCERPSPRSPAIRYVVTFEVPRLNVSFVHGHALECGDLAS
jgi:hypothetical protein